MLSKRLINSNDAAAGGACTTNNNDYPTTNLAYYKMSTAADEKDTYNGTASNVNFNVQGKFGNAAEFNGSSSNMALPFFSFVSGVSANFTASLWFNVTDMSASNNLIQLSGSSSTNSSFNVQLLSDGTFRIDSYGVGYPFTGLAAVSTNNWYNLVLVNTGGTCTPYLNGSAGNVLTHNISFSGSYSNLGSRYVSGSLYTLDITTGKIDQVRIFDSALNASQVTQLYNEVYCVPTIVPTDHFEPVIYTGNGGTKQITTLDFQPDFTWIKNRNNSASSSHAHALFDSVRTSGYRLVSNTSAVENNYSTYMTGFNSGGFNLSGNPLNDSAGTYASWNWKAGGAEVQNNDGTIQGVNCLVSANTAAGFSIVKYVGNSSANGTVGTGLSSAAEMIIVKNIENGSALWSVYNSSVGANQTAHLNTTAAYGGSGDWNSTTATDSVFSIGSSASGRTNSSGQNHIAYAFHSVDGFSKMGSYKGNGSATGPTVVTGFRPAFIMVKNTTTGNNWHRWYIFDNKRDTTNPNTQNLAANVSTGEPVSGDANINFLSNGFQISTPNSSLAINQSGNTFIFMAFAEEGLPTVTRNAINPFGDSSELALYKFEDNATNSEDNVTASSTSVTYASGYIDKAAVFNGSSSYIDTNTTFTPNLMSFSAWVNPTNSSSIRNVLSSRGGNSTNYKGIDFGITSNGNIYNRFDNGGSRGSSNSDTVSIPLNTWTHLAFTIDMSNSIQKVYKNGVFMYQETTSGSLVTGNDFYIGRYFASSESYWQGQIDQVRIFNRVLDDGEVTALYNE